MPKQVVDGATLQCDQGTSPGSLTVAPKTEIESQGKAVATVAHHVPMLNVPAFGMCRTQANPSVAAATAAAQGVLTPQPCVPVIPAPWTAGSTNVTAGASNDKALTDGSTCKCNWTGTISVQDPGSGVEID